jgi:hypothetical protein
MTAEWVTALATLGTFVVIGASAVAAVRQLRHMQAANQLQGILALEEHFRDPDLQAALTYVQSTLPSKLQDPHYRDELERRGYIDSSLHPELLLCNWFNKMGLLVKHRIVSEAAFMDLFARLIVYYWDALAPAIALMRRSRGQGEYHDFEFLALRGRDWLAQNRDGVFPKGQTRRAVITDEPVTPQVSTQPHP